MSSVGNNQEIFIMNPDGTGRTNLTNHPAQDDFASLSPDGTKIVFWSGRTNDVYTMNPDGTNVTNVSNNGRSGEPAFSPDGTKIVFVYHDGFQAEIYIMNSDGTNQTRLTNDLGVDLNPSFSADGTKIVWAAHRTGNYQIYIMNVDGSSQTRLTNHPGSDAGPSFSPDGTKIAFTSFRDNNVDIYIMNPDGTSQTNLTINPTYEATHSFSPDGTKIAFASTRDGNYEIYSMNTNGTNQTRVTNDPALDFRPSWGVINDATPPVITPTVTGTAGNNGWYTSDVQVSWSVTDAESAVSGQTGCDAQTVSTDTGDMTITCSATSVGGTGSESVTIKRDATAPAIAFLDRTAPNAAGWNNGDVTVNWGCSDATSGATSSGDSETLGSEGANQTATGTCQDNAGNTASDQQAGINIDKTAPSISFASRTAANSNGWNNTDVVVNWNCSDALSGVVNSTVSQTVSSEGINQSATGTCTDRAGNSASNMQTGISIDKTAPTLTLKQFLTPFPNDHKYRSLGIADMVAGVGDSLSGSSVGDVQIEKVTSDEPDNAPGNSDGNTVNDILIAANCQSVQLRGERDGTKNGRVYVVTLRVRDLAGNATRAEYKVSVPISQNGNPAVQGAAVLTRTSTCP